MKICSYVFIRKVTFRIEDLDVVILCYVISILYHKRYIIHVTRTW